MMFCGRFVFGVLTKFNLQRFSEQKKSNRPRWTIAEIIGI